MMPNALLASYNRTLHSDRESSELRRYAREEWRSQVHWIRTTAPSVPLRERLGRWLRRERMREAVAPAPMGEAARAPQAPPMGIADVSSCLHPVREELGLGGTTVFLRCTVCGEVLVLSGHRVWSLNAAEPPAAAEPSCA